MIGLAIHSIHHINVSRKFFGKNIVVFTCRNDETTLRKLMFLVHLRKITQA